MMAMPIMVVSSVRTHTPKRPTDGAPPLRERTVIYEGSSGPRELLESIVIQANAAIKGLEGIRPIEATFDDMTEEQKRITSDTKGKSKEAFPLPFSEENQKLLGFCQRILATAEAIDRSLRETKGEKFLERLQEALPKIHSSDPASREVFVSAEASEEAVRQMYISWATRVRFEYCDLTVPQPADKPANQDEPPNYKFYYNTDARMLASSDIPKRSLAIAKEVCRNHAPIFRMHLRWVFSLRYLRPISPSLGTRPSFCASMRAEWISSRPLLLGPKEPRKFSEVHNICDFSLLVGTRTDGLSFLTITLLVFLQWNAVSYLIYFLVTATTNCHPA